MSPLWTPPSLVRKFNNEGSLFTLTANAIAHLKGAYTEVIASTPECFGLFIHGGEVSTAATNTAMLLDLALGGIAAESVIIPDLNMGAAFDMPSSTLYTGRSLFVPLYIPSGQRLAARIQAAITLDTISIRVIPLLSPTFSPYIFSRCTAYGVVSASSRGTAVTTGNPGAWTEMVASTTRDHSAWIPLIGLNGDTTETNVVRYMRIGAGAAASEVDLFGSRWAFSGGDTEFISGPAPPIPLYASVPSGTRVVARLESSSDTEARDVIVYAFD